MDFGNTERSKSMNDYIKREDAMSVIREAFSNVDICPSADVVEVVRCKDCKWRNKAGCALQIVDDSDKPSDNDYCSYGERKSEK